MQLHQAPIQNPTHTPIQRLLDWGSEILVKLTHLQYVYMYMYSISTPGGRN